MNLENCKIDSKNTRFITLKGEGDTCGMVWEFPVPSRVVALATPHDLSGVVITKLCGTSKDGKQASALANDIPAEVLLSEVAMFRPESWFPFPVVKLEIVCKLTSGVEREARFGMMHREVGEEAQIVPKHCKRAFLNLNSKERQIMRLRFKDTFTTLKDFDTWEAEEKAIASCPHCRPHGRATCSFCREGVPSR